MSELIKPKTLSQLELDFCELYIFGCDPFAGDARRCYEEIFNRHGNTTLKKARELLAREDISAYVSSLRKIANIETVDLKTRLTEKLLHIIEETSTAEYTDRRGTKLSPAPLRSVAVQAAKTLMDLYPIRAAQESKLELSGGDGNSGITFNVIVPQQANKTEQE